MVMNKDEIFNLKSNVQQKSQIQLSSESYSKSEEDRKYQAQQTFRDNEPSAPWLALNDENQRENIFVYMENS